MRKIATCGLADTVQELKDKIMQADPKLMKIILETVYKNMKNSSCFVPMYWQNKGDISNI